MLIPTLALFATATLFGGMILYSFGFAPLVFNKLSMEQASKLLREAFPYYYLFVIGLAALATLTLLRSDALSVWLMAIVLILGIAARQLLMPAINRARDAQQGGDSGAGSRFKRLHGLSVAVNFLQLLLVAMVLYRIGI